VLHHEGGQALRRLVQEQELGVAHQGAGDGEHLLFAAREEPALAVHQLAQLRKEIEHTLHRPPVRPRAPARHVEVLPDGEIREDAPVSGPLMPAAIWYGGRPVMSRPFHTTRPRRGGVRPVTLRMVVVLPTPLRPSRQTHSPRLTWSVTPKSTWDNP
jgi:hypothetical protein